MWPFGLISTASVEAQNSWTQLNYPVPLHSFHIRHPQTKVEPIIYTTKCRITVPSDEMHLTSDLDVTACILRKGAHRASNNLIPKFPTLRKGEKRFGAYKVDKGFMVFFTSSPPHNWH